MIQREWRKWMLALGFFTRIPVTQYDDFNETELNGAAQYFPCVGLLIGCIAALVYSVCLPVLGVQLAVIFSMLSTVYLTGGFHEDGLADAVDGLGGGWQREQVLNIMQDSRVGSYGVLALVFALLGKYTSLQQISANILPVVMIVGHSVSRLTVIFVMATRQYVKPQGKAKPLATQVSATALVVASGFGLLPFVYLLLFSLKYLIALVLVLMVWWWFRQVLDKRIGGYTGDCLGAMQQLTELAFYVGVIVCASI